MASQLLISLQLLLFGAAAVTSVRSQDTVGMPLKLSKCVPDDPRQTFKRVLVPPYTAPIAIEVAGGFCLDLADYRTTAKRDRPPTNTSRPAVGSTVNVWPCSANAWTNQYWAINKDTLATLQPEAESLCLGISEGGCGSLAECSSPEAQFTMQLSQNKNSTLVHKQSGLCVTATGTLAPLPPPPIRPPPGPPNTPCPSKLHTYAPEVEQPAPHGGRPCDIYLAGGTPCVAAHSTVRALFSAYSGKLYTVQRKSDYTSIDISVLTAGGFADAESQDKFCAGTDCEILTIFDQSSQGNHLVARHPGRHSPVDYGVNASAQPVIIAGHKVYGARFDPGMGYRNDHTTGLALDDEPESIYAVMGGDHYNDVCCFDYGNAENHMGADGAGTMEAIYYGNCTSWWVASDRAKIPKSWHGPILMADLEAGMYGGNDTFGIANSPIDFEFNTLMLKGRKCEMSLKGGNAQSGELVVKYDGGRPTHADYNPMRKQGGLVLGTGGDNSDRAMGIFYEGAMTHGYASVATDDAIQKNIVAAGYKGANEAF